jgi:4-hydroxy-tetrahydrodipicolinate synthase
MANTKFHGIYPILYAFYDADENLDRGKMRRQVEACIDAGCHGIAALGFVTEFYKLAGAEKRQLTDWLAEDIAGRVPLAVTLSENNARDQIAMAKAAEAAGAAWLIIQPPQVAGLSELEAQKFLGRVMDATSLPVAVQNYPAGMLVALSPGGLASLMRNHGNFRLLKGEGPSLYVRRVIEETEGKLDLFDGRGGLEYCTAFKAGAVGLIPAPDITDRLVAVHNTLRAGDFSRAETLHAEAAPLINFMMGPGSAEHFNCYGKRFFAARAGIDAPGERAPAMQPSAFGLDQVAALVRRYGPLGRRSSSGATASAGSAISGQAAG